MSPPNAYNIVYTTETLLRIVYDCEATCVLTSDQFLQETGVKKLEELTESFGVSWFPTTRTRTGEMGEEVHGCDLEMLDQPHPEDVPFLQYTSGSTG